MSIYVGIDPDLHHAGIAVLDSDELKPHFFGVAKVPSKFRGEEANALAGEAYLAALARAFPMGTPHVTVIVEGQRVYPMSQVQPNDIVMLAQNAGVAAGVASAYLRSPKITIVEPMHWKGQMKKDAQQDALRAHLKWRGGSIPEEHASHVLDAFGLALYGIIRDRLPRAAERLAGAQIRGMIVSSQQLLRLQAQMLLPRS